ncbi:MAG TPA: hypothetical protein VHX19_05190 [Stellaceae bacterium]|nr:hypothetical protein [Stellaceae bacterium]
MQPSIVLLQRRPAGLHVSSKSALAWHRAPDTIAPQSLLQVSGREFQQPWIWRSADGLLVLKP